MELTIVSPEKTVFKGQVDSIVVPGTKGTFEILNDHAPIISSLLAGDIIVSQNSEKHTFSIHSGFVEVARNEVSICIE